MAYSDRKYCIIDYSEVASIPVDFNAVLETNAESLRKSLDGTKTFVKYEGSQPAFLSGKTEYSHSQILEFLRGSDWSFKMGTFDFSGIENTATAGETKTTQSITVTGASSVANHTYSWSAIDLSTGNATSDIVFSDATSSSPDITYNVAGTFELTISITDSNYNYENVVEKIEILVTSA
jgi:hypothetical protein